MPRQNEIIEYYDDYDYGYGKIDLKKVVKKVTAAPKVVVAKVAKAAPKVSNVVMKINPATITVRSGLVVLFRVNLMGASTIFYPATLKEADAIKAGYSKDRWAKVDKVYDKVRNLFYTMGGNRTNLDNAVRAGWKKKALFTSNKDFKVNNETKVSVDGLGMFGEVVTVTAASASAGTVFAQIWKWIKDAGLDKEAAKLAVQTVKTEAAKQEVKQTQLQKQTQANQANAAAQANQSITTQPDTNTNPTENPSLNKTAKIVGGLAIGGLGIFGLYKFFGGKSGKSRKSLSGHKPTKKAKKVKLS